MSDLAAWSSNKNHDYPNEKMFGLHKQNYIKQFSSPCNLIYGPTLTLALSNSLKTKIWAKIIGFCFVDRCQYLRIQITKSSNFSLYELAFLLLKDHPFTEFN